MSRGKKRRRRRHWNKKTYDISQTSLCTCHAEKWNGAHTGTCPGKDEKITPVKRASYAGTTTASNYGSYYCNKEHWRTPVELKNGLTIHASAWSDRPKYGGGWNDVPADDLDYGFYLDDLWTGNRITASPGIDLPVTARKPQIIHYPCVDQNAPGDIKSFHAMMEWIIEQITEGKKVDVGCIGGHGRTGLVLSSLLVMQGMDPWDAITKIRDDYCDEAVESFTQEKFVGAFWSLCNDGEAPRENTLKTTYKTTKYTYTDSTPQKPEMDKCPNCGNKVWYLDTHRGICGGHPTDKELTAYKDALPKTTAVVTSNGMHDCPRDGCVTRVYSQEQHDKYAHPNDPPWVDTEPDALDKQVEEVLAEMAEETGMDAEKYQEWLRLNTIENRRQGVEDTQEFQFGQDADGRWDTYDSWEKQELNKRYQEMDEQCPYGACTQPMECDPTEHGGCFRQLVDQEAQPIKPDEIRGWAGEM